MKLMLIDLAGQQTAPTPYFANGNDNEVDEGWRVSATDLGEGKSVALHEENVGCRCF